MYMLALISRCVCIKWKICKLNLKEFLTSKLSTSASCNDHKNNNMFRTLVETALITDIDQGQILLLKTKTSSL